MNFLLITFFLCVLSVQLYSLTKLQYFIHIIIFYNECRRVHMYESALNMPGSPKEPIYDSSCYLRRLSDDNVVKSFFTFHCWQARGECCMMDSDRILLISEKLLKIFSKTVMLKFEKFVLKILNFYAKFFKNLQKFVLKSITSNWSDPSAPDISSLTLADCYSYSALNWKLLVKLNEYICVSILIYDVCNIMYLFKRARNSCIMQLSI